MEKVAITDLFEKLIDNWITQRKKLFSSQGIVLLRVIKHSGCLFFPIHGHYNDIEKPWILDDTDEKLDISSINVYAVDGTIGAREVIENTFLSDKSVIGVIGKLARRNALVNITHPLIAPHVMEYSNDIEFSKYYIYTRDHNSEVNDEVEKGIQYVKRLARVVTNTENIKYIKRVLIDPAVTTVPFECSVKWVELKGELEILHATLTETAIRNYKRQHYKDIVTGFSRKISTKTQWDTHAKRIKQILLNFEYITEKVGDVQLINVIVPVQIGTYMATVFPYYGIAEFETHRKARAHIIPHPNIGGFVCYGKYEPEHENMAVLNNANFESAFRQVSTATYLKSVEIARGFLEWLTLDKNYFKGG